MLNNRADDGSVSSEEMKTLARSLTGHPPALTLQSAASAGMGCCGLNPENTDDVEERKRQNKQNKEIEKQVSPQTIWSPLSLRSRKAKAHSHTCCLVYMQIRLSTRVVLVHSPLIPYIREPGHCGQCPGRKEKQEQRQISCNNFPALFARPVYLDK